MLASQAVLSLLDVNVSNITTVPLNGTFPLLEPLMGFLPESLVPLIYTLLSSSALRDWIKLIVLGGLFETMRRVTAQSWDSMVNGVYIHVRIEREDDAYEWLMNYFMKLPSFNRTRQFCLSTRQRGKTGGSGGYIEDCTCNDCMRARPPKENDLKKRLNYFPAYEYDYSFWFAGTYITVMRTRQSTNPLQSLTSEGMELRILNLLPASGRATLEKLLTVAKTSFEKDEEERISVWIGDQYGSWTRAASKLRRPWSSIVLDDGIKDTLLADARDFLKSQAWYVRRGIPYRRGYLLHGVPGSGKTSLIHALSGELKLDIYVISLSKRSMDDQALNDIVAQLPPQCIALMEDIDCAFKKGITARKPDDPKEEGKSGPAMSTGMEMQLRDTSAGGVTLSGLLNAIDGVAAHEGRLLFATTNVPDALDPALIRPGRMDIVFEFKNATRKQAEELFKCFYPVDEEDEEVVEGEAARPPTHSSKHKHSSSVTLPPTPPLTPSPSGTPLLASVSLPSDSASITTTARDVLAARFAAAIPEREFSMASLQGYLMLHKISPERCVDGIEQWVTTEREKGVKTKREEEEQAAKEKKEKEDAAKTEELKKEGAVRTA